MSTKTGKLVFILILPIFILIRIWGLHLPYHQDERKPVTSYSTYTSDTPHPPLTREVFVLTTKIFGPDNFRATPLVFGVINLILLFYLVRFRFGVREAVWSAIFFTLAFYSVLASLMVDIDGEILPFLFLLSLFFYFKWQEAPSHNLKIIWGIFLVIIVVLGFLTKLSFIIVAGTLIADFFWSRRNLFSSKLWIRYGFLALGFLLLLGIVLLGVRFILPSYDLSQTIAHVKDFIKISGRAYLQILIQSVKAVLYASPLLVAPLLFIRKQHWAKFRPLFIYLFFSLFFYLILFDFSRAALDKYLALIVVPLSIISGVIISEIMDDKIGYFLTYRRFIPIFLGAAAIIFVFFLQFVPHFVPPLYPKEEWIGRIMKLKWNFLFPFTGGSGPVGFYVSWLSVACAWIMVISLAVLGIIKRNWQKTTLVLMLAIGFIYNAVFIEEYLFGKINGSPGTLLKNAVNFIKKDDQIKKVITYNDIGGYELIKIGKYERRIYAAPKFDKEHINTLNNFKGYYLVIDIPKLSPESIYAKYFSTCETAYEDFSGKISAKIYDCKKAKDISL